MRANPVLYSAGFSYILAQGLCVPFKSITKKTCMICTRLVKSATVKKTHNLSEKKENLLCSKESNLGNCAPANDSRSLPIRLQRTVLLENQHSRQNFKQKRKCGLPSKVVGMEENFLSEYTSVTVDSGT